MIPNSIGWKIWLVPWRTHLCFNETYPSNGPRGFATVVGCAPNGKALAGEFSYTFFNPGEIVIGLAPNGNRTVTLRLAHGSSKVVPVSHNVYIARTSELIRTVTLKDSHGTVRTWRVPD